MHIHHFSGPSLLARCLGLSPFPLRSVPLPFQILWTCNLITWKHSQHRGSGTHLVVWPASVLLSRWLCSHPELVRGKVIVELGAGLGLCGFVAARLGAKQVIMTDLEGALSVLHEGVSANKLHNVAVMPLLWGDEEHISKITAFGVDLVLGADIACNLDEETFEQLASTCFKLCQPQHAPFFLGYENRGGWWYDWVFFEKMKIMFSWETEDLEPFGDVPTDDDMLFKFNIPGTLIPPQ